MRAPFFSKCPTTYTSINQSINDLIVPVETSKMKRRASLAVRFVDDMGAYFRAGRRFGTFHQKALHRFDATPSGLID